MLFMHTLKRNAIVPHSARQMYELVNTIEDYPRFLPWCSGSHIIKRTEEEVVASLEVHWKGVSKNFTTQNRLFPDQRMEIQLVDGPLKRLQGTWEFIPLEEYACKITLDLEFEFTGHLIDKLFQPVFQHIANTLVEAFCKRAAELYGGTEIC